MHKDNKDFLKKVLLLRHGLTLQDVTPLGSLM